MLGEGETQGSPVAAKSMSRAQPDIAQTATSTSRFFSDASNRAISPAVIPWRTGTGCIPTNERYSSSWGAPSVSPPIGFGRSQTTSLFPDSAHASIASIIVQMYV